MNEIVNKYNIKIDLYVRDEDGDAGIIIEYDKELHNVLVKYIEGGQGLHCIEPNCSEYKPLYTF